MGGWSPIALAQTPTGAVGVYYVGPEDAVAHAINQASPYLRRVDRPEMAGVLVINNAPLIQQTLAEYGERIRQEDVGLVLFCGQRFPMNTEDLRAIFGIGTFGMARVDRPATLVTGDEADPLHTAVAWRSAPSIYARTVISNPNLMLPVVATPTDQPVLLRMRGRNTTQVFILGPWLENAKHQAWRNWPYFQYLVYRLIAEAANIPRILSFSEYPLSPLPHGELRLAIMIGGGILMLSMLVIFLMARRYLFLNPQQATLKLPEMTRRALHIAQPAPEREPSSTNPWNSVGFHRPLGGFLHLLSIGLVVGIPLLHHQFHILPQDLIPWPQVLNTWATITGWLEIAWLLLNLGMNHAAVRYFSALRLRNPREGFRYLQFYFWWQLLGGTLQLGIIAWLVTLVFPNTSMAHLSYYFMVHAVLQFPGVLSIFEVIFRGLQRFDYEQILTWLRLVTPILFEGIFVLLLRRWGAERPSIGQAMGSMFGLGVSLYLARWGTFIIGLILYKRMDLELKPLLLPDFDAGVIMRMLGFGARLTFGALAIPLGALFQTFVLTRTMRDYTTFQTAWNALLYFIGAFNVLSVGLFNSLMPAVTEAYTQGYQTLTRYYVGQGIRYGMWFSLFIFATLEGIGERFILGFLGEPYALAARVINFALLWAILQWPFWLADATLQAVDRPAIISWLTLGEQIVRSGLLLLLVGQWQILGLLMAYILPLLLKDALAWILTGHAVARHTRTRIRFNLWQSLIVPGIAAFVIYTLLRRAGDLWWIPTTTMSLRLGLGVMPALLVYGFFTGLLGGWDDGGLVELRQAVTLSSFGYLLAWLLYQSVRLGTRLSFLHGRFPLALYGMAQEEAHALTQRRKLVE
jgi:O-antigen/teichoic acid export membrane protein